MRLALLLCLLLSACEPVNELLADSVRVILAEPVPKREGAVMVCSTQAMNVGEPIRLLLWCEAVDGGGGQ